jgi:excisionase family DNA binding protein
VNTLASAVLDALGPDELVELARRLAPYLPAPTTHLAPDGWLTTKQAADYLGMTANALHKLTAARTIPFEQDAPGGKCWFRCSDLDAWRCRA